MKQDSVVTLLAFGAEKRDRWTAGLVSASFEAGHGGQGQGEAIVKVDPRVLIGARGSGAQG